MATLKKQVVNFNIDRYLNPIVPSNQLKRLPQPVSRWFGYRREEQKEPPTMVAQLFAFIGAFAGLLVVGAIYKYAPGITQYNPPVIIASLGASAILEYNAITTPLSQPRNAIVGHAISAIIGVGISKAFQHSSNFDDLRWVAGALACAIASVATGLTNTVHPPGGATAVLACVEAQVIAMGWFFVPVIMTGTCVMLAVALLSNNITRQYPTYWWAPGETGTAYRRHKQQDEEQTMKHQDTAEQSIDHYEHDDAASDTTLARTKSHGSEDGIYLSAEHMTVPAGISLSLEESNMLQLLQSKLKSHSLAK